MIKGLDSQIVRDVIDTANAVLKETGGTHPPVDTARIVEIRYSELSERLMRGVAKLNHDKKRQFFADAMWIIEQEYLERYGNALREPYVTLGARYLLMPDDAFYRNVKLYDFSIFELLKELYTNVCIEDIAYHLVDECDCSAKKYSTESGFGTMRWDSEVGNTDDSGLRIIEIELVRETLEHLKGMFSMPITEDYKITGWKDGDTVMLIYNYA